MNDEQEQQGQDAAPTESTVVEETVERTEVTPADPSTPAHEVVEETHADQADNSTVVEETVETTTTTEPAENDGESD